MQTTMAQMHTIPKRAFQNCFQQWKVAGLSVWSHKGLTLKGIRYCNHPDTELCFPSPRSDTFLDKEVNSLSCACDTSVVPLQLRPDSDFLCNSRCAEEVLWVHHIPPFSLHSFNTFHTILYMYPSHHTPVSQQTFGIPVDTVNLNQSKSVHQIKIKLYEYFLNSHIMWITCAQVRYCIILVFSICTCIYICI